MTTQWFKSLIALLVFSFTLLLAGCGGGKEDFIPYSGSVDDSSAVDIALTGGAVKGPISFSRMKVYSVDLDSARYARFNDTANSFFKVLADNRLYIEDGKLSGSDGVVRHALELIKNDVDKASYISELEYLRSKVDNASSISEAVLFLDVFLGNSEVPSESEIDFGLLRKETNTLIRSRVEAASRSYADLRSLQLALSHVEGFFDEVSKESSFDGIEQLINKFSEAETDVDKGLSWAKARSLFTSIKESSISAPEILNLFRSKELINIAIADNDSVAASNLKDLELSLEEDSTVTELKESIYLAAKKEGHEEIKDALLALYYSIPTHEDFVLAVRNDRAIYSFLGVRDIISSADSLDTLYGQTMEVLKSEAKQAFDNVLISDVSENDLAENIVSFGLTGEDSLLPGLKIDQYRGFLYIESESTSSSIDMNSGKAPILSKMSSIIHTDDILGYGDNSRFDESIYFIKNGIIQRDSEGEIIVNERAIEATGSDTVLTVNPSRFSTPLTSLAVNIAQYKFVDLAPQNTRLTTAAYQDLSPGQKLRYFSMDERQLSDVLDEAQRVVAESLNVTEGNALPNLFGISPVAQEHMKYLPDSLVETYRYRASIEFYGSLVASLKNKSELSHDEIHELLSMDLYDGQIDGKQGDVIVGQLNDISEFRYFSARKPSEAMIADTDLPVSQLNSLLEAELTKILGPRSSYDEYLEPFQTLSFISAKGGIDSDDDGLLDNDDPNPFESNSEVLLSYPGLRSVSVQFTENKIVPLDRSLILSLPIQEVVVNEKQECASDQTNCILVGDLGVNIDVETSIISSPTVHNAKVNGYISEQDGAPVLVIDFDSTAPGEYDIYVELRTGGQSGVLSGDRVFGFNVPVKVLNLKDLEFRVNTTQLDSNSAQSSSIEVRVTQEICQIYSFCGSANDRVGEFIDIQELGSVFRVDYNIDGGEGQTAYQQVATFNTGTNSEAVVSNLDSIQSIGAIISYTNKNADISLGEISASVNQQVAEESCIESISGVSNINGELVCFSDMLNESTTEVLVSFDQIDETWLFDTNWDIIIRRNTETGEYIGYVSLPTDKFGNHLTVDRLIYDSSSSRVYIAFSNGQLNYYSLILREVSDYYVNAQNERVVSWQLVGANLLVNWQESGSMFLNPQGNELDLSYGTFYPYSGRKLTPSLDGTYLTNFNNEIGVAYQIERNLDGNAVLSEGRLASDSISLESSQTQFGDKLTLSLTVNSIDGSTINYDYVTYVLDNDGFSLSGAVVGDETPITVGARGLDLSKESVGNNLYVKWYLNDETSDELVYEFTDIKFPYSFDSSRLAEGDIVSASIYLKRSDSPLGDDDVLLESIQVAYLEELSKIAPEYDVVYRDSNQNLLNADIRLVPHIPNDDFFTLSAFSPVWYINGTEVPGENGFDFPSNSSTVVRLGDQISVLYKININQSVETSQETILPSVIINPSSAEFSIIPRVAIEGENISLDFNDFNPESLLNIRGIWSINGDIDTAETSLIYPGSKLKYGDTVSLKLSMIIDESDPIIFDHEAPESYVGLNMERFSGSDSELLEYIDTDGDGVPNYRDYFRFDSNCSVVSEGRPDDADGDGLPDLAEVLITDRSNPHSNDTDSDGLHDLFEVQLGSSVILADTDGDGYSDSFEYYWGSNPIDASVPIIGNDSDLDGLPDENELTIGSLIRHQDSDGDGLEDGLEVKLGTDPLNVDTDGDYLSDGVEVKITSTNPLLSDSESAPDGLSDGFEVAISNTNPNSRDTDGNGVADNNEPNISGLLTEELYEVLFMKDLDNYSIDADSSIPSGVCFTSYLAQNPPSSLVITQNPQIDANSDQQILFLNKNASDIVHYDATNSVFLKPINKGNLSAQILSASFARYNSDVLYVGFSDGSIWSLDLSQEQPSFVFAYQIPGGSSAESMIDEGGALLVSSPKDDKSNHVYVFEHALSSPNPSVGPFDSAIDLSTVSWDSGANKKLWGRSVDQSSLVLLELNDALSELSQSTYKYSSLLGSSVYLKNAGDNKTIITSEGVQFDTASLTFSDSLHGSYVKAVYHQDHVIQVPKDSNGLNVFYGDSQYWQYKKSYSDRDVFAIVPSGYDALVITKPLESSSQTNSVFQFEPITTGDSDVDGLPQWWESIYPGGTLAEFETYSLPSNYEFPEQVIVKAVSDDGDEGDLDSDGVANAVEIAEGSCAAVSSSCPNPSDSDQDGLSDFFEINYAFVDESDVTHTVSLIKYDTDSDGLSDFEEIKTYGTYPDIQDSDLDNICDAHEIRYFGTDPQSNDSDGDGLSDGDELGIVALNCSEVASNAYFSDPQNPDSDNDGLNDREEFLANTEPLNSDTDGDGLLDGDENSVGANPLDPFSNDPDGLIKDGSYDSDGDGLSDRFELYISHSDPSLVHSDSDDLSDFQEVTIIGSNPNSVDTDGDGICDKFEDIHNLGEGYFATSPIEADTDSDELLDSFELGLDVDTVSCDVLPVVNMVSNPVLEDSDSDGLSDGDEHEYLFEYDEEDIARHPELKRTIDPLNADSDGDFLCDSIEVGVSNPAEADTDLDGLTDPEELQLDLTSVYCGPLNILPGLTSPRSRDTDGDGLLDGHEILTTGTNPLDVDSDDDGIPDGQEDSDGDGLSDEIELLITLTDINNPDTDGDNITDDLDDLDGDGLSNIDELKFGTCVRESLPLCPDAKDSDQDGLSDFEEVDLAQNIGSDPLSNDSDEDGLSDNEEFLLGTSPVLEDTDLDGITDYEETVIRTDPLNPDSDYDFLDDSSDPSPLNPDADSDSLIDGIEVHVLDTNPEQNDSDGDGLLDGEEAWVYAYEAQGHSLLSYGLSLRNSLNSRSDVGGADAPPGSDEFEVNADGIASSYALPTSYDGSEEDAVDEYQLFVLNRIEVLTVDGNSTLTSPIGSDISEGIGSLHVRLTSDPSKADSDFDGLDDYTELMQIEKHFGSSAYDVNPSLSSYMMKKANKTNFDVSDPLSDDTDNDGIKDGQEDIDGDFYVNLQDLMDERTSIISADTDNDSLPDGIEFHITNSNPAADDSDGDGLLDGNKHQVPEITYEVIYDILNPPRSINTTDLCDADEYRINNIVGVDYCVSLSYISDPTSSDSDGDGVLDREVTDSDEVIFDNYPLDPSCSVLGDGVINADDPLDRQCYSSWMAERGSLDQIKSTSWDDLAEASHNYLAFTGSDWGRIVRYKLGSVEEDTYYLPHIDLTNDSIIETSSSSKGLFIADATGLIRFQDFEGGALLNFAQAPAGSLGIQTMLSAGDSLFVISSSSESSGGHSLLVYDSAGDLVSGPTLISETIVPSTAQLYCSDSSCSDVVNLYLLTNVEAHSNKELLTLSVDLGDLSVSDTRVSSLFSSLPSPISGPIEFSENGVLVYLGSGQQVVRSSLATPSGGLNLEKYHGVSKYSEFFDLKEENKHFVALVEDQSPLYDVDSPTGVFVEDLNHGESEDSSTKYLMKQMSDDESIVKIIPQRVGGQSDLAFLSVFDSLVDITPIGVTDQDMDGMPGIFELVYGLDDSNPLDKFEDLDNDGLTNIEEYLFKLKPNNPDSNGNGVTDFQEALN